MSDPERGITGFPAVGAKDEGVHPPSGAEMIEDAHVGVHVVDVVGVRWVLQVRPLFGSGYVTVEDRVFRFTLVVHGIESDDLHGRQLKVKSISRRGQLSGITCLRNQWSSG